MIFPDYRLHFILLFTASSLAGCSECEECPPLVASQPYVNVEFHRFSTQAPTDVAIISFNEGPGSEIEYLSDTVSSFRMPLSMQQQPSEMILHYAPSSDFEAEEKDTLKVDYTRSFFRNERNLVMLVYDDLEVISHTWDSLSLICKDTLGICNSNEATIRLYF